MVVGKCRTGRVREHRDDDKCQGKAPSQNALTGLLSGDDREQKHGKTTGELAFRNFAFSQCGAEFGGLETSHPPHFTRPGKSAQTNPSRPGCIHAIGAVPRDEIVKLQPSTYWIFT